MGLTHTVSGDVAHFRTPSRVPIDSLKFHFLPKQEGSGDPSPSNVRPIAGWTGLNGWRANNNLFALSDFEYASNSKVEYTIDEANSIKIVCKQQGSAWDTSSQTATIDIPKALCGKAVYFGVGEVILETTNKDYQRSTIVCEFRDENNTFISDPTVVAVNQIEDPQNPNTYARKFTIPSNAAKLKIYFRIAQNIAAYGVYVGDYIIYKNFYIRASTETYGYVKHEGGKIPLTFPVAGTNKLNPSDIMIYNNHFTLENNVYKNAVTDTRSTIQLAVQLWKTTGTYIKTLYVDYLTTTGRHSLTFTVDDPNGHYICLKHNGIKKDFILLFPWRFGLHQFTLSLDVLSNDPTTIGGIQLTNIQLEPGDTSHSYEPYSSDNTFYGGYIDPVAGEISENFTYVKIRDLSWVYNTSLGRFATSRFQNASRLRNVICDSYKTLSPTGSESEYQSRDLVIYSYGLISETGYFVIHLRDSRFDNVEDFVSAMGEHYICYESVSPKILPIAPQDLKAFLDHNNFWSDANDITEVSYEVTESKDIQMARKRFEAEENGHHKLVRWNQRAPSIANGSWGPYDSTKAQTSISGDVLTRTMISSAGTFNSGAISTSVSTAWVKDHIYYYRYNLKSSVSAHYMAIVANEWTTQISCNADEWTVIKSLRKSNVSSSGTGSIWVAYSVETLQVGDYAEVKDPILIDLTQMFGAGNEPTTAAEFERICSINGIDLTTYQPYDSGSDRWLIVP